MLLKKCYTLSVSKILGLLVGAFFVYFLLVQDSFLPFSIHFILTKAQPLFTKWPVLEVGLLPVYMAFMIFGMAILGLYLGTLLERFLERFKK